MEIQIRAGTILITCTVQLISLNNLTVTYFNFRHRNSTLTDEDVLEFDFVEKKIEASVLYK